MQFSGLDKRKNPRQAYSEIIECRLNLFYPSKFIYCPCVNLSETGLCVYSSHRLYEGDLVEISESRTVLHQKAVVKWVRLEEGFYKTGFMFLN